MKVEMDGCLLAESGSFPGRGERALGALLAPSDQNLTAPLEMMIKTHKMKIAFPFWLL